LRVCVCVCAPVRGACVVAPLYSPTEPRWHRCGAAFMRRRILPTPDADAALAGIRSAQESVAALHARLAAHELHKLAPFVGAELGAPDEALGVLLTRVRNPHRRARGRVRVCLCACVRFRVAMGPPLQQASRAHEARGPFGCALLGCSVCNVQRMQRAAYATCSVCNMHRAVRRSKPSATTVRCVAAARSMPPASRADRTSSRSMANASSPEPTSRRHAAASSAAPHAHRCQHGCSLRRSALMRPSAVRVCCALGWMRQSGAVAARCHACCGSSIVQWVASRLMRSALLCALHRSPALRRATRKGYGWACPVLCSFSVRSVLASRSTLSRRTPRRSPRAMPSAPPRQPCGFTCSRWGQALPTIACAVRRTRRGRFGVNGFCSGRSALRLRRDELSLADFAPSHLGGFCCAVLLGAGCLHRR
jgi:hypothetical protein